MSRFLAEYRKYSSEYLIELRARGDDLQDEAHEAIEAIFLERKEVLPSRPVQPIYGVPHKNIGRPISRGLTFLITVFLCLVANGIAKVLGNTKLGLVVSFAILIGWIVLFFVKTSLPDEERTYLEEQEKVKDEGLTELMVASAKGDIARVRDLIAFGFDVNDRSSIGTTALMYAVKNNYVEVARLLLDSGADKCIKSNKGSTALTLAEQNGNEEIALMLRSGD